MVQRKINAKCLNCGLIQEITGDIIDGHPIRLRESEYTTKSCSCTKCKSGDIIELQKAKDNKAKPTTTKSGTTDADKIDDTKTVRTGKSNSN